MKKSSYQKLKEENQKLRTDIYSLVMNERSIEAAKIREVYRMKFSGVDAIMFSSRQNPPFSGGGIMDQIIKDDVGINSIKIHRSLLSDDCIERLMSKPYVPEYITVKNCNLADRGLPYMAEFDIPEHLFASSGYSCTKARIAATFRVPFSEILTLQQPTTHDTNI